MDDRLLSWSVLFEPEASFCVVGHPQGVAQWPSAQAGGEATGVISWGTAPLASLSVSDYRRVVVLNGSRGLHTQLERDGFEWVCRFAVLPSAADPRFLIPVDSPSVSSRALGLYSPHSRRGRWLRRAITTGARLGVPGWFRDHLTIGARVIPPLVRDIEELVQAQAISLAFATGRPMAQNKRTVGVLDDHGRWLAFVKAGSGTWVRAALANEAAWLRELAASPLADTVPVVLQHLDSNQASRLIVAPGPESPGPDEFGTVHLHWLSELHALTKRQGTLDNSTLAVRMGEELPTLRREIQPSWARRIEGTFAGIHARLGQSHLPLSVSHGDFAPWNTRVLPDGRLYVFDWEMAQGASLPLRDMFHFAFMTAITLGDRDAYLQTPAWMHKHIRALPPSVDPALLPTLFAAYLVDLALTYLGMLVARSGVEDDLVLRAIGTLLDHTDHWWHE